MMGLGLVVQRSLDPGNSVEIDKARGGSDGPPERKSITSNEVLWMMDGSGFGHGFGILFWILILVLVVVAAGSMLRGLGGGTRSDAPSSRDKSALEILETRYARGEIEHDEFERRKRDLQDRNNSS